MRRAGTRPGLRRVVGLAAAAALLVTTGCSDSEERAKNLETALAEVKDLGTVDVSRQSNGLTNDIKAEITLVGELDRKAYDRVAAVVLDFAEDDDDGLLGGAVRVTMRNETASVDVPLTADDVRRVGGQLDALRAEVPEATSWRMEESRSKSEISVETDDPRQATDTLAADGGRLDQARGDREVILRVRDSSTSLASVVGRPHPAGLLDDVESVDDAVTGSVQEVQVTERGVVAVTIASTTDAKGALGLHDAVREHVCDSTQEVVTQVSGSHLQGCGDTKALRALVTGLDEAAPTSIRQLPQERIELRFADLDSLVKVADADLEDELQLRLQLDKDSRDSARITVHGTPPDIRRYLPVAVAAARQGEKVSATAAPGDPQVTVTLGDPTQSPDELFRAMRGAGWEGELVFGLVSYGTARTSVRFTSTATGRATDVGPHTPSRRSTGEMGETTKRLIAAWDATGG